MNKRLFGAQGKTFKYSCAQKCHAITICAVKADLSSFCSK